MMADETVPRDVPLVRLVDPDMSNALSHWAILNALDFWRHGPYYRAQQQQKTWALRAQRPSTGGSIVGVMGVGAIGTVIAQRFAGLGFSVRGWARTARNVDDVEMFAGVDGLAAFADGADIIVSVLPLTPDTRGVMNKAFLTGLRPVPVLSMVAVVHRLSMRTFCRRLIAASSMVLRLTYLPLSRCHKIIHSGHIRKSRFGHM